MGKKSKTNKIKKDKILKSKLEKQNEIDIIKVKISNLGLGDGNKDIKHLYEILDKYLNIDSNYEGQINLNGYKRIIKYILPKYNNHKCSMSMIYQEHI